MILLCCWITSSELFLKEDGSLIQEGDILQNPKLGETLSRIAEDPDTFYRGSLAEDMVADMEEYGKQFVSITKKKKTGIED